MQSKMQEQFTQTKHYFALAKKDIFTPYLLGLTFLPLFFALLFIGGIFYFFGNTWYATLYDSLRWDLNLSIAWLAWIQSSLDYIIQTTIFIFLVFLFLIFSLLLTLTICSFLAPFVVHFVRNKHYPTCPLEGNTSTLVSLFSLLGVYLLYLLFLVLLLPLYFVPFIGSFVILLPNFWLFSKTLVADVGEGIFEKKELKRIKLEQKSRIRNVVLPLYGLSLIPIIGFFAPVFALTTLAHLFLNLKSNATF
ncbi:EI24 domain-containing protein [Helicobacter sp. UBA3407]|uniref:EI24 domain-containing protein n=1 Tax=Helicobacter TaxID=209 RepID=UPI002630098C|nr:EI24 domain-containing protein [Helicobacter sp. UBA3407]